MQYWRIETKLSTAFSQMQIQAQNRNSFIHAYIQPLQSWVGSRYGDLSIVTISKLPSRPYKHEKAIPGSHNRHLNIQPALLTSDIASTAISPKIVHRPHHSSAIHLRNIIEKLSAIANNPHNPTQHTPTQIPRLPLSTIKTATLQESKKATMDSLGGGLANIDVTKLSDSDKQQLQQFAVNEGQKARIQSCTSSPSSLSPLLFTMRPQSPNSHKPPPTTPNQTTH